MRKRILLTTVAALALTVGMTGVAHATHRVAVQTADLTMGTTLLPKTVFKNTTINIVTSVRDSTDPASEGCQTANPPDTCILPPKASLAQVDFDQNMKLNWASFPKCNPSAVAGQTFQQARNTCPAALIGTGSAVARGGVVGQQVQPGFISAVVSAFNSTNTNGIILHVDISGLSVNLNGVLVDSPRAGFGKQLRVVVPNTGTALTRFQTNIVKPGYVQARCPSSPIDLFGLFTFGTDRGDEDANPTNGKQPFYPLTAAGSSAVGCTKQVEPYLGNCKRAARRRAARKIRRARRTLSGAAETRAIRKIKRQRRRAINRCIALHG
jgi:hypothetical protein